MVTGHTSSHAVTHDPHIQIGRATLCRRGKGAARLMAIDLLLHRAPRAECLTGLRAGTPVSRSVYADSFVHRNIAPYSLPVATLRSAGQI